MKSFMFIKSSHRRPDTLILRCFSEDNTFLETLARNGQRVAFLGAASASAPLIRERRGSQPVSSSPRPPGLTRKVIMFFLASPELDAAPYLFIVMEKPWRSRKV